MNTDRLTKALLAAIAVALWMIALNPWLRPITAGAQTDIYLQRIADDVSAIAGGVCLNPKIC